MDFVVEKKAFDSTMRQILLGRKGTPDDLVDLTAEATMLTVVALGTSVQGARCQRDHRERQRDGRRYRQAQEDQHHLQAPATSGYASEKAASASRTPPSPHTFLQRMSRAA